MVGLLKLFLVFAIVVFIIHKKVPLGVSLVLGAFLVAFLFGMNLSSILSAILDIYLQPDTCSFVLLVALVLALSIVMEKSGQIDRLTESLRQFLTSPKLSSAILPAIVGLLPMPGGALFSAPMVKAATSPLLVDEQRRVEINHWFRHVWEYSWPLYPGIIYTATILKLEVKEIFLLQFPLSVVAVVVGFVFIMRRVPTLAKTSPPSVSLRRSAVFRFILDLFPFILIFILYLPFNIPLLLSLFIAFILTVLMNRIRKKAKIFYLVSSILTASQYLNFLVMAFGVKLFSGMLLKSGAISELTLFFNNSHFPPVLITIFFPFIIGFVAGITIVYCTATFPLLVALPQISCEPLPYIVLAFTAGFSGTMLSPIHACLSLSAQYFNARLTKVLLALLLPAFFVLLAAFALFLLYSYWKPL
ncbi:MAG: DUF401 family protein [Planctomycetota bacterium]|nr:DUF401 family protein [Planctomycetota bacterium]